MLKAIYTYKIQDDAPIESAEIWKENCGLDLIIKKWDNGIEDVNYYLKRIERTGLIKEIVGAYFDYVGGVYRITKGFKKMMDYINFEVKDTI